MNVLNRRKVPTGDILTVMGERGKPLELLSIGDYGKRANVKADFMGIHRDISAVPHQKMLPLEEKWVVTVSSQYGCSMGCSFCDVPKVGPGLNATHDDLVGQVMTGIALHPDVQRTRLNVHFARMGEPTWNRSVVDATEELADILDGRGWEFHPVVSTMMPSRHNSLALFLRRWLDLKRRRGGNAGLQVSVNTTDERTRFDTFGGNALPLAAISAVFDGIFRRGIDVVGRKIALNFALNDAPVDAVLLARLFDPQWFMCKLTPMHKTDSAVASGNWNGSGFRARFPYQATEGALKKVGFDVIVFVPSDEEDESRITCGNAILSEEKCSVVA